jgi:uncharacterized protein YggE
MAALAIALMPAAVGLAQEPNLASIESEGVGTVHTVPTYAEFWLEARAQGATVNEAVEAVLTFEPRLREALEARELKPTTLSMTGVAVPDVQAREAKVSAQVVFSLPSQAGAEDAPIQFATLCDAMQALAADLKCAVTGPRLGVSDKEAIEAAAVSKATEAAYPAAQAAAELMNANLTAVGKLVIERIAWNEAPEVNASQPDLRGATCTATVRVTYTFGEP